MPNWRNGPAGLVSVVWVSIWEFKWESLWKWDGNGNRNSTPTASLVILE